MPGPIVQPSMPEPEPGSLLALRKTQAGARPKVDPGDCGATVGLPGGGVYVPSKPDPVYASLTEPVETEGPVEADKGYVGHNPDATPNEDYTSASVLAAMNALPLPAAARPVPTGWPVKD